MYDEPLDKIALFMYDTLKNIMQMQDVEASGEEGELMHIDSDDLPSIVDVLIQENSVLVHFEDGDVVNIAFKGAT